MPENRCIPRFAAGSSVNCSNSEGTPDSRAAVGGGQFMGDSLRQHDLHQVRRVSPDGDLSGEPRPRQNRGTMNRAGRGVKSDHRGTVQACRSSAKSEVSRPACPRNPGAGRSRSKDEVARSLHRPTGAGLRSLRGGGDHHHPGAGQCLKPLRL